PPSLSAPPPAMAAAKPSHPEHHDETSPLEWALAAVSALLVLGVIGFLLYEAVTEPPTPPAVTVDVVGVRPSGNGYVVEFEAHNEGGETAARLTGEGTLVAGAGEVEASEANPGHGPEGGRRGGGPGFTRDPGAARAGP